MTIGAATNASNSAARALAARPALRYQLDVIATSIADVVTNAGGWVFDRTMEGWDVTVLLPRRQGDDIRPLQILGAKAADLETSLAGDERNPDAICAAERLYETDPRIRHAVGMALNRRNAPEVALWGPPQRDRPDEPIILISHELSSAAAIFKARALEAAGVRVGSVDPVETFCAVRPAREGADVIATGQGPA